MKKRFETFLFYLNLKKSHAFTLIELMTVLIIIVLVATMSIPKVNKWIARNRAKAVVATFVSDFSYALNLAKDSYVDSSTSFGSIPTQTAMIFAKNGYVVLKRNSNIMTNWSTKDLIIKKVQMPGTTTKPYVEFVKVNGQSLSSTNLLSLSGSTGYVISFSSSGMAKDNANSKITSSTLSITVCGSSNSPFSNTHILVAYLKVPISSKFSLWYQIEFNSDGDYFICMAPNLSGSLDFSGGHKFEL